MGGPTTGAPRTSCSCFEAKTARDLLCPGGKGPSHSSRCCANRGLDIGACAAEADTEFGRRIVGAEQRSCLALRFGRTHRECTVSPPLLNCALCWNREVASTCEPLLVAGRGHRDSSGQPPTTARRSPRRADQEHGGASRAGAGQPAQPGPRQVPRSQRLPFPKGHACPHAPRTRIACEHLPNDTRNRSVQTLYSQPALQISVSCSHP